MPEYLTQIDIVRPGDIPPRVFDFFAALEFPGHLSSAMVRIGHPDTGDWRFSWYSEDPLSATDALQSVQILAQAYDLEDQARIQETDITISRLETDTNWLAESYRGFPPFSVGRFFLYGQHHMGIDIPAGQIPLCIDAATAFGSGEHPTTKGCLLLLDHMQSSGAAPVRILDLGTGSGILAIAAKKLWPDAHITAVDNDPESVKVAAEYAAINDVSYPCILADTPAAADVAAGGPYDLVIANILAAPLQMLAPDIAAAATTASVLILSGLLERQMDDVMGAYTPFGYRLEQAEKSADWAAIRLQR